jgi:hypothetical protein
MLNANFFSVIRQISSKPTKHLNALDLMFLLKYLSVFSVELSNPILGKLVLIEAASWLLLNCHKIRLPMFTAILDSDITSVEVHSYFINNAFSVSNYRPQRRVVG